MIIHLQGADGQVLCNGRKQKNCTQKREEVTCEACLQKMNTVLSGEIILKFPYFSDARNISMSDIASFVCSFFEQNDPRDREFVETLLSKHVMISGGTPEFKNLVYITEEHEFLHPDKAPALKFKFSPGIWSENGEWVREK